MCHNIYIRIVLFRRHKSQYIKFKYSINERKAADTSGTAHKRQQTNKMEQLSYKGAPFRSLLVLFQFQFACLPSLLFGRERFICSKLRPGKSSWKGKLPSLDSFSSAGDFVWISLGFRLDFAWILFGSFFVCGERFGLFGGNSSWRHFAKSTWCQRRKHPLTLPLRLPQV